MAITKVYNGSAWVEARVKVYTGSVWEDVPKFYDGTSWIDMNSQGPTCSPSSSQIWYTLFSAGTCYATVSFNLGGTEYMNSGATDTGYTTSRGAWLDSGLNSEVWINRIINSGTLNRFDAGAGRKVMSSTRTYGISTTSGTKTTGMTFEFWDAASGGNLLATVTYNLKATIDAF